MPGGVAGERSSGTAPYADERKVDPTDPGICSFPRRVSLESGEGLSALMRNRISIRIKTSFSEGLSCAHSFILFLP